MVNFDPSRDQNARELLDNIWERLSEGGRALMPLDKYDFSERYGWIEDKYGLSWQLILSGPEGDPRPAIMLEDQRFTAMESAQDHRFDFNEAGSLMVRCETQEDIDYYWDRLSAVPEAEQCGWLKDRYGVSWQVAPEEMERMMREGTPEQVDRVTKAFLPMKKFDLEELRKAYEGR